MSRYKKVEYTPFHIEELHRIIEYKKPKKKDLDKKFATKYIEDTTLISRDKNFKQFIKYSQSITIFKGLNSNELMGVVSNIEFHKLRANEKLFSQGESNQKIHYILSGELIIINGKKNSTKIKSGEIFGEVSSLFNTKTLASVKTTMPSVTVSFEINKNVTNDNAKALASIYRHITKAVAIKLARSYQSV